MTNPIEVKNLRFSYAQKPALDDVSFALNSGQITSVLGPNGAGKTTLIRIMLGLLRPDEGKASLFGENSTNQTSRNRTGAMLQISGVPGVFTVRELVQQFRVYYANPMPLEELFELTQVAAFADQRFEQLSGGQQQRAMFALSLCGDPEVLFLDEPTVGLDTRARRAMWAVIQQLRNQGKTIILTTHYLDEADRLSDRVLVMRSGQLIADQTPLQLKSQVADRKISITTSLSESQLNMLPGVVSARAAQECGEDKQVSSGQPGYSKNCSIVSTSAEQTLKALLDADPEAEGLLVEGAALEDAFEFLLDDSELGEAA